ncbi:MAG: hypothetical protein FJ096_10755 [Deltaproteobacteria bacterium]|nr:hypothetical protein [Deltaproteobacteria bacterium]
MKRGNVGRSLVQRWLVGGVGLGALLAVAFGGCSLERGGTIPKDCTASAQCDDDNPCTIDVCDDRGLCGRTPDDDIVLEQKPYDCQFALCEGGEPVITPDPKDFDDDGESCTVDSCEGGTVTHAPLPNGTKCTSVEGAGTCGDGKCNVECKLDGDCNDKNDCTVDSCDAGSGFCLHDPQDGITVPDNSQVAGDCQVKVCKLGKVVDVHDNADVPVDLNPCTADICTEGMPSNPNQPIDFGCSKAGEENQYYKVCDDAGACVECNQPEQCAHLPVTDDCFQRTCTAGICGENLTATDTVVSPGAQNVGDCQKKLCDGTGGMKSIADDTDLPPDDGNACTKNLCKAGKPDFTSFEPLNTKCGNNGMSYCNGTGTCVGCTQDSHCPADTFCQDNFCDLPTGVCKATNKANNTPLPLADQVVGDCKVKQCNGMGGVKTVNTPNTGATADLPNDNNPCTRNVCNNGTPSNPNESINTACSLATDASAKVCNATGTCVECTNAATHCGTAPDCKSPSCSAAGKCGLVNDADLSVCDAPSQTTGDCKTRLCDGAGTCSKSSNVNDGTADNIACTSDSCVNGSNVYLPLTLGMTAAGFCDANNGCNGKPCACDGEGLATSCKTQTGNTCADGTTCTTGFCVNNICCGTVCNDLCSACSALAGNTVNGTCGPAKNTKVCRGAATACDVEEKCDGTNQTCGLNVFQTAGTNCGDAGTECTNQDECDGAGACTDNGFKIAGTGCGDSGTECRNQDTCNGTGTCTDNGFKGAATVCRASAGGCDPQEVCNGMNALCPNDALTGFGMTGTCNPVTQGCDGANPTCKLLAGQPCMANSDCASGMCDNASNLCN